MELTIEHYCSYLPYNVKIQARRRNFILNTIDMRLVNLSYNSTTNEYYIEKNGITFSLKEIQLFLRPLSDLTKEIEVNGEKFVPAKKLFLKHKRTPLSDLCNDIINGNELAWKYKNLLEWHFDIYSLIDNGLAIDINTLNNE